MKKKLLIIGGMIFIIITVLSGCQEQEATTAKNNFERITFESNVVELVNASLDFKEDNNVVVKVDVKYLFKNIAGKVLTIEILVKFYDKFDNLLATGGPKYIILPDGYTEQGISPANIISYSGEKASEVDHVVILATED